MIVIDTSVWKDVKRGKIAEDLFIVVESKVLEIYEPKIFVMLRRLGGDIQIASKVFDKINLVGERENMVSKLIT